ncbi:MAG: sugar ABC transporter permease, partial [Lachnospiraceae bacterium]|nr:sugar ABC transporter permease [Lachnospiraceae bacterium]
MGKMSPQANAEKIASLQAEMDHVIPQLLKEEDIEKKKEMTALVDRNRKQIAKLKSGKRISKDTKRTLIAYSFIAPNFIGFAVFTLIPVIFAFALAFMEWDGSNPMKFVGIDNFARLLDDTFFKAALKNTLIYCVGTVPLTLVASLALAILLNQKVIGRGIFRTLSFFPYVASLVAVTAVWKMLFSKSGPVNAILYYVFDVPSKQLPQWFTGNLVLVSYVLFSVWKYMGYYMVIYLAGLQGI